jgi:hypothetical protein
VEIRSEWNKEAKWNSVVYSFPTRFRNDQQAWRKSIAPDSNA